MVDTQHLHDNMVVAKQHQNKAKNDFLAWAESVSPGGGKINFKSTKQKQHFLFGMRPVLFIKDHNFRHMKRKFLKGTTVDLSFR